MPLPETELELQPVNQPLTRYAAQSHARPQRKQARTPLAFLSLVLASATAAAQQAPDQSPMPAMNMPSMNMVDMNAASMFLMTLASGTSLNPDAWTMPMMMRPLGHWNTMLGGVAFVSGIQQTGPRGGDKIYSTNWMMASAEHKLGENGAFQAEAMLSLEPATVADRRYPLLFQTGETAYGKPIVDGQHPHNFVMSLGFHYVRGFGTNTFLDLYAAPVGDPAIGPTAYPHRASASEIPQAPISHHWQDSTHISDDVVTAGITHRWFKAEASGFHGAEPGENRWIIQQGTIDSYSGRLWLMPAHDWAAQVSAGHVTHPEALEPGDQTRVTASVEYSHNIAAGTWSSSLIWGRTHNTANHANLNSYLAESVLPLTRRNLVTARFELVDKDDLLAVYPGTFRIGAYMAGYTRELFLLRHMSIGLGANFTAYSLPDAIKPYYGSRPLGGNIFLRFRLK